MQAPLARACYVLAREFGWTPEEVSGMTIGQILLYLEMTPDNGAETSVKGPDAPASGAQGAGRGARASAFWRRGVERVAAPAPAG